MAVRTEELQLRVLIDGSPARRELAQLDQEYAKLATEIKGVKKNTQEWVASTARMDEIRTRQTDLRKEIGLTALTAKQLGDEMRRLQVANRNMNDSSPGWQENSRRIEEIKQRLKELNNEAARAQATWNQQSKAVQLSSMTMAQLRMETVRLKAAMEHLDTNGAQFAALRSELTRVEQRMASVSSGLSRFGRAWQGVKSQVVGTVAGIGMLFTGGAIMGGIRSWVTGAANMSDALADVRRTTNLTEAQANSLNKSFGRMDTRTPRRELLALASDAGKLGISAERDVLGFVRAGNQIRVALGDDLGDDAIKSIGKLTATFKISEQRGMDLEKSLLSTGSAINALGQSSTAAESYLVDYATRMAGVNVQAGISIENTLGYAAAADQLGLKVETTSTAMSQFSIKAFKEPAEYAKIAGMATADFAKLLKEDTNEALLRVLEGLNGNNAGMEVMVQKFGDLGQEGARAVSTLAAMSGQTKMIREQQDIANKSFAEGVSITTEYNTKNENFAANLAKIGKALHGLFVNSTVVKGFKDMTGAVVEWMRVPVSEKLEEERFELQLTYAKVLQYTEGSKERTAIIRELQAQYPSLLANMDAEKVTNAQLADGIRTLNQELVNKIILQQQDEKIQDQVQRQADMQMAVMQREDNLRRRMVALAEEEGMELKQGVPLMEQAIDLAQRLNAARTPGTSGGGVFSAAAMLGKDIDQLHHAQGLLNAELSVSNKLATAREDLMKRLGMDSAATAVPTTPEASAPPELETDPAIEEGERAKVDAALKAMQGLRGELDKIRRGIELDALSADEREIAALDDKFAELRAKVLENTAHTEQDLIELDSLYQDARAELLTQQAAERERQAVEAKRRSLAAVQQAEDEYWESQLGEEDAQVLAAVQRMEALVDLYEKAGLDTQDIVARTEAAINAIRQQWRTKEEQEALDAFKKRIADQVRTYQAVGSVIGGVNDVLAAAYEAAGNQQYQQTAGAKMLGLAQIAISTGVGVANAIASGSGVPFPANLAAIATGVAAVLSGIAQATRLLSVANVSRPGSAAAGPSAPPALQNVPLGEKGGIFSGPSHARGGSAVVDRTTGQVVAEVEGGEPWMVLSNAFRQNNPGLIPRLLHASATGTRLAASGGIFTPAPAFNFRAATESLRYMQLARGGLLNAQAATPAAAPADVSAEILQVLGVIAAGIDRVDNGVRTQPERIQAEVSLQDLNRRQTELASLQDINRVRR